MARRSTSVRSCSRVRCPSRRRCTCTTAASIRRSSSRPAGVILVVTRRRSALSRSRAMSPASSIRSSSRVTSGTCATSRWRTSLRQRPRPSAPRRMRSTLYCVGVTPYGRIASAKAWSSTAAVRPMATCASSSSVPNGFRCFSSSRTIGGMSERMCYNTICQDNHSSGRHPAERRSPSGDPPRRGADVTHARSPAPDLLAQGLRDHFLV